MNFQESDKNLKSIHYNDWPNAQGFDVTFEERTPISLEVKGTIPYYAAGVLFRTGLGPRDVQTDKQSTFRVNHWFDSLSQIHRFQLHEPDFEGGSCSVTYNSRLACDGLLKRIKKTGNRQDITFGANWKRKPDDVTVAVTMSINFPGLSRTGEPQTGEVDRRIISSLCNKTDAPVFQMIDDKTLEPIGIADQKALHPLLKGAESAAHAKSDPITGDVFNFNLDFGRKPTYRIFTVSTSTGETSVLATFTHRAAYIHSLFLTEHYVILCAWNSQFKAGGASVLYHQNIVDALQYGENDPAAWFVVDKAPKGRGLVAIYDSNAFFAFHTINAFEELTVDGRTDIVADLCAYENMDCLKRFFLDNLISDSSELKPYCDPSNTTSRPNICRFKLPSVLAETRRGKVRLTAELVWKVKKASSLDLPTINPAYSTKPHQYVYGVMDTGKSSFLDGLGKYDVSNHSTKIWSVHGHTAGEPVFVSDPRASQEDDALILSVVLDGFQGSSYLLCLDAKTMCEIGRANVDGPIGFGFHGAYVRMNREEGEGIVQASDL